MKKKLTFFLRSCVNPLLMALGSVPLMLLFLTKLLPGQVREYWIFPAVYVALLILSINFPGKYRYLVGMLSALLILGIGCFWWRQLRVPLMLLPAAFYAIMLLTGLRGSQDDSLQEVSSMVLFAVHLIMQVLVLTQKEPTEAMLWATPRLTWSFLFYLLLLMLSLNRSSLRGASQGRHRVPAKMRRQHRMLVLVLFAAALLITMIPGLIELIEQAWNWLTEQIKRFLLWLVSLFSKKEEGSFPPDFDGVIPLVDIGQETNGPRNDWEDMVVALIRLAFFLAPVLLIVLNWKKIKALLKKIWAWLMQSSAVPGEDYDDNVTATRNMNIQELLRFLNNPNHLSAAQERALSPEERIRYRFLRTRMKHPEWDSGATAREKLPDPTAGLYEKVRYGDMAVTEAEADQFAEAVRKV